MYVDFEIAALFPSPYRLVQKRGNFTQPFIWSPSIRSYIILALVYPSLIS